jgi:hypothetical protein
MLLTDGHRIMNTQKTPLFYLVKWGLLSLACISSTSAFAGNEGYCRQWRDGDAFVQNEVVAYNNKTYTSKKTHTAWAGANWNPLQHIELWTPGGECKADTRFTEQASESTYQFRVFGLSEERCLAFVPGNTDKLGTKSCDRNDATQIWKLHEGHFFIHQQDACLKNAAGRVVIEKPCVGTSADYNWTVVMASGVTNERGGITARISSPSTGLCVGQDKVMQKCHYDSTRFYLFKFDSTRNNYNGQ